MNRKKTVVSTLAALGIVAFGLQPANAQGFMDYLRGAVRAQGGVAGDFNVVNSNMRTGLNNLSAQIQSNQASGQLSYSEAAQMQARLSDLEGQSMNMGADGVYTTAEVQDFLSQLSNLSNQVNIYSTNANTAVIPGYGAGYGFRSGSVYLPNYDSVYNYQQNIWRDINNARVSEAMRRQWRNEYNDLHRYLTRQNLTNRDLRNNRELARLIALQERIRAEQRKYTASPRHWDGVRHRWY